MCSAAQFNNNTPDQARPLGPTVLILTCNHVLSYSPTASCNKLTTVSRTHKQKGLAYLITSTITFKPVSRSLRTQPLRSHRFPQIANLLKSSKDRTRQEPGSIEFPWTLAQLIIKKLNPKSRHAVSGALIKHSCNPITSQRNKSRPIIMWLPA